MNNQELVLKTGCLGYYDTVESGLIPVKVLSVTAPAEKPRFDLGRGAARVSITVRAQVTADHGAYKKGMLIDDNSVGIVPRGAIRQHQYSTTIALYRVAPDAPAATH